MGFDDVATSDLDRADAAVVGTLGSWIALNRPSQRTALLEEGVLLFDPKDRLLVRIGLIHRGTGGPSISGMRGHVPVRKTHIA